jgi:presqualene diphosphate synthase
MNEGVATQPAAEPSAAPARASGSSFYLAMKLLPAPKREAMFEIYGFCRAVDDIADGDGPRPQRRANLQLWRTDIDDIYRGAAPARLARLVGAVRRFDLQRDDFLAVIDGMAMDVDQDIRAPDLATLDLYCDRVASAVGRLSVRVFEMQPAPGERLAHHLGRALQLTNILRDLDEDAGVGRLYLPREALLEAGIETADPASALAHPGLGRACAPVVDLARNHFAEASRIMAACPRATIRAPRLMAEVYRRILDRLVSRGWSSPRARVRIGRANLLWILLRDSLF